MIRVIAGFALLMVMISVSAVYHLKQTTDALDARKNQLSSLILKDQAAIKVLKAEMAYLSRPERLERLSTRFLVLAPGENTQMISSITDLQKREDGRGETLLASMPVDDFRLLLPRPKPQKKLRKNNVRKPPVLMQASVKPAKEKKKNTYVQKKSFYERMIAKLERP